MGSQQELPGRSVRLRADPPPAPLLCSGDRGAVPRSHRIWILLAFWRRCRGAGGNKTATLASFSVYINAISFSPSPPPPLVCHIVYMCIYYNPCLLPPLAQGRALIHAYGNRSYPNCSASIKKKDLPPSWIKILVLAGEALLKPILTITIVGYLVPGYDY